ncbi:MAG: LOG family protein, partial [Bacteroidota bacterium]
TLDEYFEALTLIQTKKISGFPVIVFGKKYHAHLWEHIENMKRAGTISEADTSLFLLTDSIEESLLFIKEKSIERYGLMPRKKHKPLKWLLEKDSDSIHDIDHSHS